MKTFLQLVARDLYSKKGTDLSRTIIVFPNKRAGLFFNEYLANESDEPLWAPVYVTISDLFRQFSALKPGDPIRLVCELHKVFCRETGSTESLDEFYFWGELLIADFDDADKNLVNADRLFTNLQNLKNISDDFNFLSKEHEESVRLFFQNFSIERRTELKEKFISLWDKLGIIYRYYRENLFALNIGYEGMLWRNAVEQSSIDAFKHDTYVFVGFNVLNRAEKQLFTMLQDAGKALFYWDYDVFYTQMPGRKHEAGEFINQNLKQFPSSLPADLFDTFCNSKSIRFISSPTENAQARYLSQHIESSLSESERENAVVLCNEALLPSVLRSIPSGIKNVNITMGYPLAQTPVYSFIKALTELQTTGYSERTGRYMYANVQSVLKHPYTRALSSEAEPLHRKLTAGNRFYPLPSELGKDEFLSRVFIPCNSSHTLCLYLIQLLQDAAALYRKEETADDAFNQLYRESLFKSYTVVNRLSSLIESGELGVQTETFKRLLNGILFSVDIPFHGEPAIGLQIMGVLETRNLDFKNLTVLSLNEGKLPKSGGEASFIPYNLRKAFGMTTAEHRDAMYSYHFYRMIQRAENVTLLYNTSSDGLNRGEWSRFMLQLLVDWPGNISREFLEAGQALQTVKEICIEKTAETIAFLRDKYDVNKHSRARFSPSALNVYMDCRMKFYYRYVARLKVQDEISAGIDSAAFGSIFHRSAELVYKELTARDKLVRKEDIEKLLHNRVRIQNHVDNAFKELFFHASPKEKPEYNGIQLINSKVIASYIVQLLRNDLQYAPFELVALEEEVEEILTLEHADGLQIKLSGIIDRMDSKDGVLRIVDYKTGGSPKSPVNVEQLFVPADDRPNYVFQTFLYAAIMSRRQSLKVAPGLLYIHRAASESYSPVIEMGDPRKEKIPVCDFTPYEEEFRERLHLLLEEIYNPEIPFTQTPHTKKCLYCDFKAICKR